MRRGMWHWQAAEEAPRRLRHIASCGIADAAATSIPFGGVGPNIIARVTGTGGESGRTAWTYCAAAGTLAVAATLGLTVAVRTRRRNE